MRPYFKTIIVDTETPISLFEKVASSKEACRASGEAKPDEYAFLLESAETNHPFGRYSFIGFEPMKLKVFAQGGTKNPLVELQKEFEAIKYEPSRELPSLQAGFVGYFTYEIVRHLETLNLPIDLNSIPEGLFFLPKYLIIFDHFARSITLVAYSQEDLAALVEKVTNKTQTHDLRAVPMEKTADALGDRGSGNEHFEALVKTAQERVVAGEVFQIVLSQQFDIKTSLTPFEIYRRLRVISPSPYLYYLQYPNFSIVGSSPETLVRTEHDDVIIRPIAGTRRRGETPEETVRLEKELLNDEKEQAEHMMLVDLGRNDVGRIAKPGTVRVTRLMEPERYSHVIHLVSEVRGKRHEGASLFDVFRAAFPAGTLTGAPKIRAMEIIAELEEKPRDIYGGAVGYFDLSGNMDFAIAIRTMICRDGNVTLRAGAGIVYDSLPKHEHKECCNKARGPLTAAIL